MSRALDADTIASLQKDPTSAYVDIVKALGTETGELLEIEFLGKSHPLPAGCNVLIDGNSIAIPKTKLVQAFVVARQILFKHLRENATDKEEEIRNAAGVVLLMDPEHLTAANARKRLIQKQLSRPMVEVEVILKSELHFVDSYLTSRLHRHTKSPTLWGHRRWLLETSKSIRMEHAAETDLKSVILVAAERHPRNYYAWTHLRWLLEAFPAATQLDSTTHLPPTGHATIISIIKDWCLRHPSDTSGFSFLLFCLLRTTSLDSKSASERSTERSSVCSDVLKLAVSFKWTHESVWVFLRTLVAAEGALESDINEFYSVVKSFITIDADGNSGVKAAGDWCMLYQQN